MRCFVRITLFHKQLIWHFSNPWNQVTYLSQVGHHSKKLDFFGFAYLRNNIDWFGRNCCQASLATCFAIISTYFTIKFSYQKTLICIHKNWKVTIYLFNICIWLFIQEFNFRGFNPPNLKSPMSWFLERMVLLLSALSSQLRNECLFSTFMGNELGLGTWQIAWTAKRFSEDLSLPHPSSFPMNAEKIRHSFLISTIPSNRKLFS